MKMRLCARSPCVVAWRTFASVPPFSGLRVCRHNPATQHRIEGGTTISFVRCATTTLREQRQTSKIRTIRKSRAGTNCSRDGGQIKVPLVRLDGVYRSVPLSIGGPHSASAATGCEHLYLNGKLHRMMFIFEVLGFAFGYWISQWQGGGA